MNVTEYITSKIKEKQLVSSDKVLQAFIACSPDEVITFFNSLSKGEQSQVLAKGLYYLLQTKGIS